MKPSAAIALDTALWAIVPAVFLAIYVLREGAPSESVLPHLRLVLVLLAAVTLLRLLAACTIRHGRGRRAAVTALVSLVLGTMVGYYTLVLVGMQAWGRVVSWELIQSYAP